MNPELGFCSVYHTHQLLYAYHEAPISAVRTNTKMYAVMRLSYFWKNVLSDIQNWVQSCVKCSQVNELPKHRCAKLEPMIEFSPFQQLHADLISPAQLNKYQYTCILTMIEKASKMVMQLLFQRPFSLRSQANLEWPRHHHL